jgi:hypothetical protein
MQMPFERLMEYAAGLSEADRDKPLGEIAPPGESAARLADAVTAVRVLTADRTYVSPAEIRASEEPVVRRALDRDRGTIVSGSSG